VKDGRIWAEGKPEEVVNTDMMKAVFEMDCVIAQDPLFGTPMCIPYGKGRMIQKNDGQLVEV
jgi:iron complex transport system ATP-binding protein